MPERVMMWRKLCGAKRIRINEPDNISFKLGCHLRHQLNFDNWLELNPTEHLFSIILFILWNCGHSDPHGAAVKTFTAIKSGHRKNYIFLSLTYIQLNFWDLWILAFWHLVRQAGFNQKNFCIYFPWVPGLLLVSWRLRT